MRHSMQLESITIPTFTILVSAMSPSIDGATILGNRVSARISTALWSFDLATSSFALTWTRLVTTVIAALKKSVSSSFSK